MAAERSSLPLARPVPGLAVQTAWRAAAQGARSETSAAEAPNLTTASLHVAGHNRVTNRGQVCKV